VAGARVPVGAALFAGEWAAPGAEPVGLAGGKLMRPVANG